MDIKLSCGPFKVESYAEDTRALIEATRLHQKQHPEETPEVSFIHTMVSTLIFRQLPIKCYAYARMKLGLPDAGIVELKTENIVTQKSSKKLETIYTDLNQALQDSADNGRPLFLMPFRQLITAKEITPIQWDSNASPLDDLENVFKIPPKEPDNDIPCDGQQTVDFLVNTTKDLASVHNKHTRGYIFNSMCGSLSTLKTLRITDVIKARKQLGLPTQLIKSVALCRDPTQQKKQTKPSLPGSPNSSSLGMIKTPTKPGTTVVHAEHVVINDEKMIMILDFKNIVKFDELPIEYKSSFPNFYEHGSGIALLAKSGKFIKTNVIYTGSTMSQKHFDKMIYTMKEAAARLSKINKTAKLEKEHSGKFMVEI